jgi:hypothetical protein
LPPTRFEIGFDLAALAIKSGLHDLDSGECFAFPDAIGGKLF